MLFLTCWTGACAFIFPVPTARHTPKNAGTRAELENRSLESLRIGSTTREEVLWKFGEPDAYSADERYLLYRWLSVAGYAYYVDAYAEDDVIRMGVQRHDMLLEFDERNLLVRYGDIETLVTEPIGDDTPVNTTLPQELSVLHRRPASKHWTQAILLLQENLVTLRDEIGPRDIRPAAIVRLAHKPDDHGLWFAGWLTYHLRYENEPDGIDTIRLQVNVLDVPRLAKYLQTRSPDVRITD